MISSIPTTTTTTTTSITQQVPVTTEEHLDSDPATVSDDDEETSHKATNIAMSRPRRGGHGVSFRPLVDVVPAASPLDKLEPHEWMDIWYQAQDLHAFRTEARELCRKMREDLPAPTVVEGELRPCLLAHDPLSRGLEQRSCLERQRRKYMAIKFIVKAQHKLLQQQQQQQQLHGNNNNNNNTADYNNNNCKDKLAYIAQRVTAWATALAIEEAARDYDRAYTPCERKRARDGEQAQPQQEDAECSTRRVRPRLSQEQQQQAISAV